MSAKDRDYTLQLLLLLLLFCLFQARYCYANEVHNLTSSQPLSQGQTLISPSQVFELGFFSPNNSADQYVGVWYKGIYPLTVVWVANGENPLKVRDSQPSLTIGSNGNLELLDGSQNSVWSTDIHVTSNGSVALLLDNGNFILKDGASGDRYLWQSLDHLADTFLSGSALGFNVKTGEKKVLTSWREETDPSLGNFTFGISQQTPPQALVWMNGSTPYWRSGPWDKWKFFGIPDMDTSYQSPLSIQVDVDKGTTYLYFNWYNSSADIKLFLSSGGSLKALLKDTGRNNNVWETNWMELKSKCDVYGVCGSFGVCKASGSQICECLKGFVPNSFEEWSKGNWTGGCVRRTNLLCKENTSFPATKGGKRDGFQKISMLKLPDFYEYVSVDAADDCPIWCLNNCSCISYAYVSGIGCLVWSRGLIDIREFSSGGEDLFIRLAREELVGRQNKVNKIIISLVVISVCAMIVATIFTFRRANQNGKQTQNPHTKGQHQPSEHQLFDLDSILAATNHFSITNKLGQGGFGPVYKGKLQDGKEIAVKRLSASSGQGFEEFRNETILISKLQHRNLVRLLGCCTEKEEKILIYEFMPNKSLDAFIFDTRRKAQLDWTMRFNIINGVARVIAYLHRDSCLRVIHRDLKVSNILLDENMIPKISDFGIARIFEETPEIANTRKVVGTIGYISPEYAMGGIFSEKSDVFSFGVLILEIVSGQKNTNFHSDEHAWQLWSENREFDFVDDALANTYCSSEVRRYILVGLLCVQDHAAERPTMPDVVFMLCNENNHPHRVQPKQPVFTFQRSPGLELLQPQNGSNCAANEPTISLIEGR